LRDSTSVARITETAVFSLQSNFAMADDANDVDTDLLDYEEEDHEQAAEAATTEAPRKDVKGTYVSIHSSGFRDFLLKPELLRAIVDCGFEHPSEGKSTVNVKMIVVV
jgi:hypothetical protein